MLKRKIFAQLKSVFSEYLYGFSEDQIEVGLLSGKIELKNLIVKPSKVNEMLRKSNTPI